MSSPNTHTNTVAFDTEKGVASSQQQVGSRQSQGAFLGASGREKAALPGKDGFSLTGGRGCCRAVSKTRYHGGTGSGVKGRFGGGETWVKLGSSGGEVRDAEGEGVQKWGCPGSRAEGRRLTSARRAHSRYGVDRRRVLLAGRPAGARRPVDADVENVQTLQRQSDKKTSRSRSPPNPGTPHRECLTGVRGGYGD